MDRERSFVTTKGTSYQGLLSALTDTPLRIDSRGIYGVFTL